MTTEKMSIHQALAELKVIDNRIRTAIMGQKFVTANKHSNEKIAGVTIQEYKDGIKAGYQKVNDLINRRNAMKRAVVLSNAQTIVTIGGVDYTVAEAIEMKNHGMEHMKILLSVMTKQYAESQSSLLSNSGDNLEKRAESYIISVIAAQPKDGKMAVDSEAMKALRKDYITNNTYDLIDPIDIAKKMEEIGDMITQFETEVDAALSVSNALTIIEFSY